MTEFKPNQFKEWEDSIVNKIAEETYHKSWSLGRLDEFTEMVKFIITRYKEEMEKQKGMKE